MALKVVVVLIIALSADGAVCFTCGNNFTCTPVTECDIDAYQDILYPCESDKPDTVCCPLVPRAVISRTASFPKECGYFDVDDKITGGKNAAIGQFPWMALLGYRIESIDFTQFLCGGSLITRNFILTAAHCLNLPTLKLTLVRLGEWNTATERDCENVTGTEICGQPHIDALVGTIIPHPRYNSVSLMNDIALLKLKTSVVFTDYIQPICLPFDMALSEDIFYNKPLTVSGWGKTTSDNLGGSDILQYTLVTVWPKDKCNNVVPPEARPIRDKQICANGKNSEDSCKGDSGGPIFNATVLDGTVKNYQYGIVSFSSAHICGNSELPTIYTRIDSYLGWIITNVK